jgi:hypothetical protein
MYIAAADLTGVWATLIVGIAAVSVALAVFWIRSRAYGRRWVTSAAVIPQGIRLATRSGDRVTLHWDELESVIIATDDSGPLDTDLWWEVKATSGLVFEIPGDQPDSIDLLKKLQSLEGFDNESVIKASCSVNKARFVCWKRRTSVVP